MDDYQRDALRVGDSHTHVWEWNYTGRKFYNILSEYRHVNKFDYVNLTCVPYINHPKWKRDASQNIMGAIMKLYDQHFYSYAGLVYTDFPVKFPLPQGLEFDTQLKELIDIGFDGIKMLETKPTTHKMLKLPPNSPEYALYFEQLERKNIPVIWHVNDPEQFWGPKDKMAPGHVQSGWWFGDGSFASNQQIYSEVYNVLERYPNLNITFAHMFFLTPYPDKFLQLLDKYPKISFDLTPNPYLYFDITENYDVWREIFNAYPERFIFGTDRSNWDKPESTLKYVGNIIRFIETGDVFTAFAGQKPIHGLKLEPNKADMVLYRNFISNCSAKPKPINIDALMNYIDKYLPYIAEGDTKQEIVEFRKKGKVR